MNRMLHMIVAWWRRPAGPPNRRGIALIACMFVLFFLASLAVSYGFAVRLELNTAQNFCDDIKAQYCAKAGIYRALAELRRDNRSGTFGYPRADLPEDTERIQRYQEVLVNQPIGAGSFTVKFKDNFGQTSVGPMDENSLINMNALAQLKNRDKLTRLFEHASDDETLVRRLVDCLIDYTDGDDSKQLDGAEEEDYEEVDPPIPIRNGPMRTPDEFLNILEMLKIKYPGEIDETVWFGEDLNGNGMLDKNEDDGDKTPPYDDADGVLDRGIKDFITVDSDSAEVNPNTASEEVLRIMLSEEEYQRVIEDRITRRLPFNSGTFRIRSYGTAHGYTHVVEWVIRMGGAGGYPSVLRMYSL